MRPESSVQDQSPGAGDGRALSIRLHEQIEPARVADPRIRQLATHQGEAGHPNNPLAAVRRHGTEACSLQGAE